MKFSLDLVRAIQNSVLTPGGRSLSEFANTKIMKKLGEALAFVMVEHEISGQQGSVWT